MANWYQAALHTLRDKSNPDRLSQAAHSMRELVEKFPKWAGADFKITTGSGLEDSRKTVQTHFDSAQKKYPSGWKGDINSQLDRTLTSLEIYLKQSKKPTRQEQVARGITSINPFQAFADEQMQNERASQLKKCGGIFQDFAHHKNDDSEVDLLDAMSAVETILIGILSPPAVEIQHQIRDAVIVDPARFSADELNRIFALIVKREADQRFFFNRLEHPGWLVILDNREFFNSPPGGRDIGDGCYYLPNWLPLKFLVSQVQTQPLRVLDICLRMPKTTNPWVYEAMLQIALELNDIDQSVRLADKIKEGLRVQPFFLFRDCNKLLTHWSGRGTFGTPAALELAAMLISFDVSDENLGCDSLAYALLLQGGVRKLIEEAPLQTAHLLIDNLRKKIESEFQDPEEELQKRGHDHSSLWCKRVDVSISRLIDPKESLVHALTYACMAVCNHQDRVDAFELDVALKQIGWRVFSRVRYHVYARFPIVFRNQIEEEIHLYSGYSRREYWREWADMVREACAQFGLNFIPEQKARIFTEILSGPDREAFTQRWNDDSDERYDYYKGLFHQIQLWPFEAIIDGFAKDRLSQLSSKRPTVTLDTYRPIDMGGGHRIMSVSPFTPEELIKKSDDELIDFLNNWKRPEPPQLINWTLADLESLARSFSAGVLGSPDKFKLWTEQWDRIDRAVYFTTLLRQVTSQIEQGNFVLLETWFTICALVLSKEATSAPDPLGASNGYSDWREARRWVSEFINKCLQSTSSEVLAFDSSILNLIRSLANKADSDLNGPPPEMGSDDLYTLAINSTRAMALIQLLHRVHWLRRQNVALEQCNKALEDFTSFIELRFSVEPGLTKPEKVLLASSLEAIHRISESFAAKLVTFLFQKSYSEWDDVFRNYLIHATAFRESFPLLTSEYRHALDHFKDFFPKDDQGTFSDSSAVHSLGNHLFLIYLFEHFPLKGESSLLSIYYQNTEVYEWSILFDNAGRQLAGYSGLPSQILERAYAFFEYRLSEVQKSPASKSELDGIFAWLMIQYLAEEWRLRMLLEILKVSISVNLMMSLVDWLAETRQENLHLTIQCFLKICEHAKEPHFYILPAQGNKILTAGLASTDIKIKYMAFSAREYLVEAGRSEFL